MSDEKDIFDKGLQESVNRANMEAELKQKKLEIEKVKVDVEYEKRKQFEEEEKIAQNLNFGVISVEQIERARRDNAEYMEAAKASMEFICSSFYDVVPFFRKNIVLVLGPTGKGKSTLVTNVAASVITQKNEATGKWGRVLILSNEEAQTDVYNRITALIKGFRYTNHSDFTDEQKRTLDEYLPMLMQNGRVNVICDTYIDPSGNVLSGMTTTIEGIKMIFDNLMKNKEYYDAILIDYYQNISSSKNNPKLDIYKVQTEFANYLDNLKNVYPAPIVVVAQTKSDGDSTDYDERIRGAKIITTKATVCLEMKTDIENLATVFSVRKGRYINSLGREFKVGYDKGRFVNYDNEFLKKVSAIKEKKMMDDVNGLKKETKND